MKANNTIETTNSSEWFDATLVNEKPSRLSIIIFIMFFVVLIFSTAAYGSVENWALGFNSILVGLIGILWLADSFVAKEFRFNPNLLQIPLICLILIGVIQLLPLGNAGITTEQLSIPPTNSLSLDQNITRLAVVQLIVYLIYFSAVLVFINTQKRLRGTAYLIIVFAAFWSFFGIIQWLGQTADQEQYIYGLRKIENAFPFASFINKHHFSAFMEMTFGLALSLVFTESARKVKLLLLLIAVVLMGMGILLTGSRGGLVSLFGVMGFVAIFHLLLKSRHDKQVEESSRSSLKSRFLVIGASFALVLILFGSVLYLGGDNAVLRGTGLTKQTDLTTGRAHFWEMTLKIIKDNPVIGTGLDSFGVAFTKYDTWNGSMRVEQAHNDYLQIFSDAGILGFICAVAFIFLLFRNSLRLINRSNDRLRRGIAVGALAGCFGILVHSFFDFPLRTPSNAFFFLTLAALATGSINYPKLYKKG